MGYNASPTRTWDDTVQAKGSFFGSEFTRIYDNFASLKASISANSPLGLNLGGTYKKSDTMHTIKAATYEVNGVFAPISAEIDIDLTLLANMKLDDGSAAAAITDIRSKWSYILLDENANSLLQLVPTTEMEASTNSELYNPRPSKDSTRRAFYSTATGLTNYRIIAAIFIDSSGNSKYWYDLGNGFRWRGAEGSQVGDFMIEMKWDREPPYAFYMDGSQFYPDVSPPAEYLDLYNVFLSGGMTYPIQTGSKVIQQSAKYLPDMRDLFIRGQSASRALRSFQDFAMQGHIHMYGYYNSTLGGGGTGNQFYPGTSYATDGPNDDGTNGTPQTDAETRPMNIAEKMCVIWN